MFCLLGEGVVCTERISAFSQVGKAPSQCCEVLFLLQEARLGPKADEEDGKEDAKVREPLSVHSG